jgi:prevent-host-death family protein
MEAYNVAEAKARLSEILQRVAEGEEVLLTRCGRPVARLTPIAVKTSILGAGKQDPNINHDVVARNDWWKPVGDDETRECMNDRYLLGTLARCGR